MLAALLYSFLFITLDAKSFGEQQNQLYILKAS